MKKQILMAGMLLSAFGGLKAPAMKSWNHQAEGSGMRNTAQLNKQQIDPQDPRNNGNIDGGPATNKWKYEGKSFGVQNTAPLTKKQKAAYAEQLKEVQQRNKKQLTEEAMALKEGD